MNCKNCTPLSGCQHGKCKNKPNTCSCDEGWEGALCDQPICKYVTNNILFHDSFNGCLLDKLEFWSFGFWILDFFFFL